MIDSAAKQPENRMHLFDPVGLINDKYAQYGVRPGRAVSSSISEGFIGAGAEGGGMRLSMGPKEGGNDSGGSSPRLWESGSRRRRQSPPSSPSQEPMSPNSRTQALARGRRELMEMIKDIPESCYELSLRDIVEKKPLSSPPPSPPMAVVVPPPQEAKKGKVVEKETPKEMSKKKKGGKKVGKSESKKKMMRNPSVDNGGFLLKTSVFPMPFRKKTKKKGLNQAPSFKVAPKLPPKAPTKGSDKHWWARKSRVSSENDAGGLATDSVRSTTTSRHRQRQNPRFLPSCCSFFSDKKMIKDKK